MAEYDVEREAFDEGFEAYGDGVGLEACPYADGSKGWSYWVSGWYQAEDAVAEAAKREWYDTDLTDYNDEGDAA